MTNRRFTDNEVIEALEIHCNDLHDCTSCPYEDIKHCVEYVLTDVLDVLKRQQAKIDDLTWKLGLSRLAIEEDIQDWYRCELRRQQAETRAETIKEFEGKMEELLNADILDWDIANDIEIVYNLATVEAKKYVYSVVKEMLGKNDGSL